ncbi:MAG: pyridoxal phosphate-dependent aminotransferase [Flavobacterium sp. BFFFF1]|uniref:DegT/DnrJ/EryC1/StrS family aminotransferase n=1 Tax=unclassified Flavobacterium TaxID=196869 RepID=UPI000BC78600|nr:MULTISPECIES: DegT/DnrJ/EryC1/StrS family aminotransferase [unclassified Flavobacterium]OYU81507.1 MAG: pyridoxal phosphate-dependent aminotransferase [Flavobacterium sp. BFFFF1]
MNNDKIWLSSPHMGGAEERFVKEAFDTNWVAPLGPNVTGLEQDLEVYLGEGAFVGALSSGTAAIHLGLILLGVKAGDEVICQSMTFSASANPILYQGATPVFVDSETETWNICPISLEAAIKDRIAKGVTPKAIIPVHLYGVPYQVDKIRDIADRYSIPILEDSAEALGSTYKGRKCGTFGDIGVLSFNGNKIITTSGGGAIVTKTKALKDRAVFFSTQSRDNAPHYQHSEIGYNYRMSNICAGIGRGQMEVLDRHVALRREMNAFYKELFSAIDGVEVYDVPSKDYFSNCWLTTVIIDETKVRNGKNREDFRLFLDGLNIESRPLWKPMHLQPVFEKYPFYGTDVSEKLFERGLCLPSGSNLMQAEKDRLRDAIQNFFR